MSDSKPNLIHYLFKEYVKDNKGMISIITILSVVMAIYTNSRNKCFCSKTY